MKKIFIFLFLVLSVNLTGQRIGIIASSSSSLRTGLVSYWKLDNTSGALTDELGGCNLTATGATLNSSDSKIGKAVDFSAATDIISKTSANYSTAFTAISVSLWIKLDALPSVSAQKIMQTYETSAYVYAINVTVETSGAIGTGVNNSTDTWFGALSYINAVLTGAYYHIVVIWPGGGNTPSIYVNNVNLYDSGTNFTGTLKSPMDEVNFGNDSGGGTESFNGRLDEILIYSRALTSAEVTLLYNLTQPM